jgi:arylsulfatase A-like enzyme
MLNSPPNVVIVMADDLGWGDPGCYNAQSRIPTPNIDRLAGEGMRLTDCHSPSAVCTPTRYALLTGRYAWRSSLKRWVLGGYSELLPEPDRPTIASVLDAAGYRTAVVGKWHLGLSRAASGTDVIDFDQALRPGPLELGFDECFIIPASLDMPPYCYVLNDRPLIDPTDQIDGSKHRRQGGEGFWRAGAAAPDFDFSDVLPTLQSQAVAFIESAAAADEPFLLYLPLSSPHTPWVPSDDFDGITGIAHYGDFVAQTDAVLGGVLDALDRSAESSNTIVVFTSDNGSHWPIADVSTHGHRANGPWRGQKADIYEGGHRVPCIIRWPGHIPAGASSDALTCLTDLFRSCADACGVHIPAGGAPDSVSQLQVWGAGADLVRQSVIHHSGDGLFAIREGTWKLIEGRGSGGFTRPANPPSEEGPPGQLYDLASDPGETQNVWSEHPAVVARLVARLDSIRGDDAFPRAQSHSKSQSKDPS